MKHKHHIVPKHMGGTDDPSNLVELTVEEHAEAHRKLWEEHGKWQDELAWKTLSGQIGREEAIKISQKKADKSWMKTKQGKKILSERRGLKGRIPWNKGLSKESDDRISAYSKKIQSTMKGKDVITIGDRMRGQKFTEEHRKKLSAARKRIPKISCENCKKEVSACMYARWHGKRCKKT